MMNSFSTNESGVGCGEKINGKAQIKSKYILQIIFDNLSKKKALQIMKYCKGMQKKLDINEKDYKNYLDIYSSIEIEVIPRKNNYGSFINLKEGESYFHIFFDDNKKEIKRNFLRREETVSKIKIIIDYKVNSFDKLFYYCEANESITFTKFYKNNINI